MIYHKAKNIRDKKLKREEEETEMVNEKFIRKQGDTKMMGSEVFCDKDKRVWIRLFSKKNSH